MTVGTVPVFAAAFGRSGGSTPGAWCAPEGLHRPDTNTARPVLRGWMPSLVRWMPDLACRMTSGNPVTSPGFPRPRSVTSPGVVRSPCSWLSPDMASVVLTQLLIKILGTLLDNITVIANNLRVEAPFLCAVFIIWVLLSKVPLRRLSLVWAA